MKNLDCGSGSAYFVGSLKNISDTKYLKYQVDFGNKIIGSGYLSVHNIKDTNTFAYQRLFYARHTHLYTKGLLEYLAKEFEFNVLAEWWFGTNVVDLYRHLLLKKKF